MLNRHLAAKMRCEPDPDLRSQCAALPQGTGLEPGRVRRRSQAFGRHDKQDRARRDRAVPQSVEKIAVALDVPEAVLFSAGTMTVPTGERGRLLQRINIQLSKLNNNALSRAAKMLTALTD